MCITLRTMGLFIGRAFIYKYAYREMRTEHWGPFVYNKLNIDGKCFTLVKWLLVAIHRGEKIVCVT